MNCYEWHLTAYDGSGEPVEVYYSIDGGEDAVQYHRGGHGTPASHASINVERFVFKGIDITDVVFELLGPNGLGELELEIEEDIQDGFGLDIEDFME